MTAHRYDDRQGAAVKKPTTALDRLRYLAAWLGTAGAVGAIVAVAWTPPLPGPYDSTAGVATHSLLTALWPLLVGAGLVAVVAWHAVAALLDEA